MTTTMEPSPPRPRSAVGPRMRRFLWVALAIAIIGEGGHQLFDRYGTAIGHHFFHIVLGGGAILMFLALVIYDIRRNGRPRLSWRLSDSR